MYPNSPHMLPEGVKPTLHKMHITCGQFDHQESSRRSTKGRRSHSEGRASLIHPQNLSKTSYKQHSSFLNWENWTWVTEYVYVYFCSSAGRCNVQWFSEQHRVFTVGVQHEAGGRWSSSNLEAVTLHVPAQRSAISGLSLLFLLLLSLFSFSFFSCLRSIENNVH